MKCKIAKRCFLNWYLYRAIVQRMYEYAFFVRTLFSFLVSYFCNLLAFSSTFLVATKISVSMSRVSLFYSLNLKSLFHLLCASERARGERASRRSIRRDFFCIST